MHQILTALIEWFFTMHKLFNSILDAGSCRGVQFNRLISGIWFGCLLFYLWLALAEQEPRHNELHATNTVSQEMPQTTIEPLTQCISGFVVPYVPK